MKSNLSRGLLLLASAAMLVAGCSKSSSGGGSGSTGGSGAAGSGPPATPVQVQSVTTGSITETIPVVGSLMTLYTVDLSPNTAGKLTNVFVREGDTVKRGEILAQIDPTAAEAEVRQDEANVLSNVAKVGQAQAQYQQAIVNTRVGIGNAKSSLASARVSLERTIVGDVPQVKQEAQDEFLQQQANYQNALTEYNREQQLYNAGAVAKSDLDNAETTYATQKAILDQYRQNLSVELQGGRPEDIATARQTVVQSQQSLQNAYAAEATVNVDKQAVVAAQAAVAQARAALTSAEQDLSNTNLVSTIDGVVSARNADPGTIAQPGTAVLEVVDLSTMYYQPTVSEDQFSQIAVGQTVDVNVDAFPGRAFTGKVAQIYPAANTSNREFSIRVTIPNETKELRPGMYARGTITTATYNNVIVVPLTALVPRNSTASFAGNSSSYGLATGSATLPPEMVYLAGPDGKAHAQNVEVGAVTTSQAQITSGLKPGDQLIVVGQGDIEDGSPIQLPGSHKSKSGGGNSAS